MKKTILVLLCCFSVNFYSQKIDRSKKDLESKKTSNTNSSSTDSDTTNRSNETSTKSSTTTAEDLETAGFFLKIISFIFYYSVVGDYENEDHLDNGLSKYPFINKYIGNYTNKKEYSTNFRLDLENNFLIENLSSENASFGNHFKAKAHFKQYFYGQFDNRLLFEKYENQTAKLSLFQFNLGYDRVRIDHFNFGFLLGINAVTSGINKVGFNYGLHTDFFMDKKFSIDATALWSRINSEPVNSFDIKGRYHLEKKFFSFGYEHLRIGTPSYNYFTIGGGYYF